MSRQTPSSRLQMGLGVASINAWSSTDILPGQAGGHVGLLPGLRTKDMAERYDEEISDAPRAKRANLVGCSAEQKVERRKVRARMYSDAARRRKRDIAGEMLQDVAELRMYRILVEEAPHIVLTLSPDIHCHVLYANKAFARILHVKTELVLGRPLWPFIHDADKAKLAHSLSVVILGAASSSTIAVRGRVRTAYEDTYVDLDMAVSAGTQGIHCRMWKK